MEIFRFIVLSGVVIFLLNGCAAMSKEECASADWHAIGVEKGTDGYTLKSYDPLKKACAKHGPAANDNAFYAGYNKGLERHCTPYGGLMLGESGRKYQNVCTPAQEVTFMPPYEKAKEFKNKEEVLKEAKSSVEDRKTELRSLSSQIESDRLSLPTIEDAKKRQEKTQALNEDIVEYQELFGELPSLQNELLEAQTDYDAAKPEYDAYREAFLKENPAPTE